MNTQMEQDLQHLQGQSREAELAGAPQRQSPLTPPASRPTGRSSALTPGSAGPAHSLTLSFTWPEPLCRRFRRYSRRHWLLPRDSWEISGRCSVREGAS